MAHSSEQLGVVALPVLCVLACGAAGASMFIAAFVAGLAVEVYFPDAGGHSVEFTEEWGQVLNLAVFFLFGLLVARAWRDFEPGFALYAVASLTVVRMLPVAIALAGAGVGAATTLFMGWFGPRGLASIVLGLVYLEHRISSPDEATIRLAVMATVLLSIFAHGLSAPWSIDRGRPRRARGRLRAAVTASGRHRHLTSRAPPDYTVEP
jgi:NhaP-type Na+/H+ or K+/H+ antiporter